MTDFLPFKTNKQKRHFECVHTAHFHVSEWGLRLPSSKEYPKNSTIAEPDCETKGRSTDDTNNINQQSYCLNSSKKHRFETTTCLW